MYFPVLCRSSLSTLIRRSHRGCCLSSYSALKRSAGGPSIILGRPAACAAFGDCHAAASIGTTLMSVARRLTRAAASGRRDSGAICRRGAGRDAPPQQKRSVGTSVVKLTKVIWCPETLLSETWKRSMYERCARLFFTWTSTSPVATANWPLRCELYCMFAMATVLPRRRCERVTHSCSTMRLFRSFHPSCIKRAALCCNVANTSAARILRLVRSTASADGGGSAGLGSRAGTAPGNRPRLLASVSRHVERATPMRGRPSLARPSENSG